MFFFFVVAIVAVSTLMSVHATSVLRSVHDESSECFLKPSSSKPITVTIPVSSIQDFNGHATLVTPPGATYTGTQTTHYANAPLKDASGNLLGSMQANIACQVRYDDPMPGSPVMRLCQWTLSYTVNDSAKSSIIFTLSSMNTRANSPTVFVPGFNKTVRSYSADGVLLGLTYDANIAIDAQGNAITIVFTKVPTSSKKSAE